MQQAVISQCRGIERPASDYLIVALDHVRYGSKSIGQLRALAPYVGGFKLGLATMHGYTPGIGDETDAILFWREIRELSPGKKIFWDAKFNDQEDQVAAAVRNLQSLGVWAFSVHASAGERTVRAAVANKGDMLAFGITVLTGMNCAESLEAFGRTPRKAVCDFAHILADAGADGIVSSPHELGEVQRMFPHLMRITPGIRPTGALLGDQNRVAAPAAAIRGGSDYLVVGRPIVQAANPVEAAQKIVEEIEVALHTPR